jgi:hypothetical protein
VGWKTTLGKEASRIFDPRVKMPPMYVEEDTEEQRAKMGGLGSPKEACQESGSPSTKVLLKFFVPLALQATSQSLTYPLVAIVASRGEAGPAGLAGLAQSNMVMFLLSMLGAGVPSAGMVFGRTREGWKAFFRMNATLGLLVCGLQGLLSIPPISSALFGGLIGLPPTIEHAAKTSLAGTIVLQFLFFLRNPYQVALLVARESGKASAATLMRIALTGLLTVVFSLAGWVGVGPAVICLTLPVLVEVWASAILARPYIQKLERGDSSVPGISQMVQFVMPLSAGGLILALSGPLLGAFMARAPEPERTLPVYYLAMGLTSPMAFSASRIQSVVLAFAPQRLGGRQLSSFAFKVGLVLGMIPLFFILPPLAEIYYVSLQKLPTADLPRLRVTALVLAAVPIFVALRSEKEGMAAWFRRPGTVLWGQVAHVFALVSLCLLALQMGLPGHLIGPLGLISGNICSRSTIHWLLSKRAQVSGRGEAEKSKVDLSHGTG